MVTVTKWNYIDVESLKHRDSCLLGYDAVPAGM